MPIGDVIHKFRKDKKMTLAELTERSGVALATLSRMENNRMTGTLESHISICKALDITLADLYKDLPASKKTVEVLPKKAHTDVFVHDKRSTSEMLASKVMDKKMMPILIKIQSGGTTQTEETKTGVEKFLYVLNGKIEATVGAEKYHLTKGDTLYFEGSLPHNLKNTDQGEAQIVAVISPPTL
ncbi:MAG: helix-turn-helix transcriptional regulator [Candidatus Omnitrophica bacterium]|nr:helix-turn-helix transcriptional regulator [Candidatus Omnitrophota bacterium]